MKVKREERERGKKGQTHYDIKLSCGGIFYATNIVPVKNGKIKYRLAICLKISVESVHYVKNVTTYIAPKKNKK